MSARPPYRFAHRLRVGFDETDAAGIVYYGRYMPYFDRARVEYLRSLGVLVREPADPEFVMRAQHVEYHAPAAFDDELDVFVRVRRIGTALRSSRSTRTSVCAAVTMSRSSRERYAASSYVALVRPIFAVRM